MWKWKPSGCVAVGRRLVQREDIGEGHLPEIVETDEDFLEHSGEIRELGR